MRYEPLKDMLASLLEAMPGTRTLMFGLLDLKLLRQYSPNIRTYSMLQNPQIPRLAEHEGLKLLAG